MTIKNEVNPQYEKYKGHFGHHIVMSVYGDVKDPEEMAIECEDCNCVLTSENREEE